MSFKARAVSVVNNVTPGSTAIITIPIGNTIDQVFLLLKSGLTAAHLTRIVGKINDRVFYEDTGTKTNLKDAYQKTATSASMVTLDFTERNARNGASEQLMTALASSLFQKLTFEVDISASAPAGIRLDAAIASRLPTNNIWIKAVSKTTHNFTSGENTIDITAAMKGLVKRVAFNESTPGMITAVEVWKGQVMVHNIDRAVAEEIQKRNDKIPQTGMYMLDFVDDGNMMGVVSTADRKNDAQQPIPTDYFLKVVCGSGGTVVADWDLAKPYNA